MPSIHAARWISNVEDECNELYWFNVLSKDNVEFENKVVKFNEWHRRKVAPIKGEYTLSKKSPELYDLIRPILEITENQYLHQIISQIKPDIIHVFEMQTCFYPIIKTLKSFTEIKIIYSCWGSDLFYYQNFHVHLLKIKKALKLVDLLHVDNTRDKLIASKLGYDGVTAVIPGGGGYKIGAYLKFKKPISQRSIILIKGYEHDFGRALNVLKAIKDIHVPDGLKVVVFGAHAKTTTFINENKLNIETYGRHDLNHVELLELMGKAYIYIGNSISDGMPNTLIESMIMGAFPIQSNPGGSTEDLVIHHCNGCLLNNPLDIKDISNQISFALNEKHIVQKAFKHNELLINSKYNFELINKQINDLYNT
ncbi:glycosyltransferase [Nonlabens sp.]